MKNQKPKEKKKKGRRVPASTPPREMDMKAGGRKSRGALSALYPQF